MKVLVLFLTLICGYSAFAGCDLEAHGISQKKVKDDYNTSYVGSFIFTSADAGSDHIYFMAVFDMNSSFEKYLKLKLSETCSLKSSDYLEKAELPWPWNEN